MLTANFSYYAETKFFFLGLFNASKSTILSVAFTSTTFVITYYKKIVIQTSFPFLTYLRI